MKKYFRISGSALITGMLLIYCSSSLGGSAPNLEKVSGETILALRQSIVQLRDVELVGCNNGIIGYCDEVKISNIEISLIDLEYKYRQLAIRARSSKASDSYNDIAEKCSNALDSMSDIKDAMNGSD